MQAIAFIKRIVNQFAWPMFNEKKSSALCFVSASVDDGVCKRDQSYSVCTSDPLQASRAKNLNSKR